MLNASIDSDLFYRFKMHVLRVKQSRGQVTQETLVEKAIFELLERDEKKFEDLVGGKNVENSQST
jgi:hypothetical protein